MTLLDVSAAVEFDDSIISYEFHSHKPYASTTYNNNDEIRIPIQHQDVITDPSNSYLYIEGKFTKNDGAAVQTSYLTRNAIAFLFQEIRYELNGVEIDRTRNVGIASTLKTYISASTSDLQGLARAGWFVEDRSARSYADHRRFSVCVPLSMLSGFFEDNRRIIMNAKQELILVRSATDTNSYVKGASEDPKIIIDKLMWKMPHIEVSDEARLKMLKILNSGSYLPLSFRSWDLYEFPLLPVTNKQSWHVTTSAQLETPRFVILAFQTGRRCNSEIESTVFDNCKLTNASVFLNSERFPYDNLNLDWSNNVYSLAYDMYTRFRPSYYQDVKEDGSSLSMDQFKELCPITIIDCSRQNESIKSGPVDLRIEFEASENFPANTAAYALILHDRMINYNPLTGIVQRVI